MATKYANYIKGTNGDNISFIPPMPTETMRGGIIAKAKTDETVEIAVDATTGKAYVPAYPESMNATQIVEDDDHKFVTEDEKAAWSEGALYSNDEPTVNALGGIPAGTTFDNMSVTDVLNKLLYPYVAPVVSAKSTPNGGTYEKGASVDVSKITVTVTKKSDPITKVEVFDGTTSLGVNETGTTGAVEFALTDVAVTTNKSFKAEVTDASGNTVTANTTGFTFVNPLYRGVIDQDTEVDADVVTGLTKEIVSKGNKSYPYTTGNQKMVFAYPKSYGSLKSIKDPNQFDVTDTWTVEEVDITTLAGETVTYYVCISKVVTVEAYTMAFNF